MPTKCSYGTENLIPRNKKRNINELNASLIATHQNIKQPGRIDIPLIANDKNITRYYNSNKLTFLLL